MDGSGRVLPPSSFDFNWKVAANSIAGIYNPAVVMDVRPPSYYNQSLSDYTWISISATGSHTGNQDFYYKKDFTLPCFNFCGKSYTEDNVFCLDLNIYTDNSIFEIYVNGIPQSGNLGNIFPLVNPYNPPVIAGAVKTSVSLCKDWKPGINSIIVQVASSAIVTGLLIQSSLKFPPITNTVSASICFGDTFNWGGRTFKQTGNYSDTFLLAAGCDSISNLNLTVTPRSQSTIVKSICQGQSFSGYSTSGIYVDRLVSSNGCDSFRTIQLSVSGLPDPSFNSSTFCTNDSIVLSPGLFLSYVWQDGSTLDHYIVKKPGLYSVTVNNTCGSAKKEVLMSEKSCDISFPNAFTPNNDGKNDFFKILTSYTLQDYHLSVYNRWGQKIFETTNPAHGWRGDYQGKVQQSGTFTWYCRFRQSGVDSKMKGTVVLIK